MVLERSPVIGTLVHLPPAPSVDECLQRGLYLLLFCSISQAHTLSYRSKSVATMTSESARTFVFEDSTPPVDAASIRATLLSEGANPSFATVEWIANHYRSDCATVTSAGLSDSAH